MPRFLSRFTPLLLATGLATWGNNPNPNPSPYIFIKNAGFENPALPLTTQVGSIPDWDLLQGAGQCPPSQLIGFLDGVLNSADKANYDGSQVGFARGCGATNLATTISQTLPTAFALGVTYTISVDVFKFSYGSKLALGIGATGLEFATQETDCNQAEKCTLSFNYTPPYVNVPITIQISVRSGPTPTNGYLGFDNVRLTMHYNTPVVTSHGVHGMFGPLPGQTVHSNAVCAALSPSDCTLSLDLLDSHGVLVSQQQTTLRAGMSTALDYAIPEVGRSQTNQELIPIWFLGSGQASFSFEIFDSESGRTILFTNWADGSASTLGNLDSGPVSLTHLDSVRVRVFCDGSVPNSDGVRPVCNADLRFADTATGRVLKESRMTLQPDTGGFVDLLFEEASPLAARVSITPMVTITGGPGVASVALLDRARGGTLVQSLLSLPVTAGR